MTGERSRNWERDEINDAKKSINSKKNLGNSISGLQDIINNTKSNGYKEIAERLITKLQSILDTNNSQKALTKKYTKQELSHLNTIEMKNYQIKPMLQEDLNKLQTVLSSDLFNFFDSDKNPVFTFAIENYLNLPSATAQRLINGARQYAKAKLPINETYISDLPLSHTDIGEGNISFFYTGGFKIIVSNGDVQMENIGANAVSDDKQNTDEALRNNHWDKSQEYEKRENRQKEYRPNIDDKILNDNSGKNTPAEKKKNTPLSNIQRAKKAAENAEKDKVNKKELVRIQEQNRRNKLNGQKQETLPSSNKEKVAPAPSKKVLKFQKLIAFMSKTENGSISINFHIKNSATRIFLINALTKLGGEVNDPQVVTTLEGVGINVIDIHTFILNLKKLEINKIQEYINNTDNDPKKIQLHYDFLEKIKDLKIHSDNRDPNDLPKEIWLQLDKVMGKVNNSLIITELKKLKQLSYNEYGKKGLANFKTRLEKRIKNDTWDLPESQEIETKSSFVNAPHTIASALQELNKAGNLTGKWKKNGTTLLAGQVPKLQKELDSLHEYISSQGSKGSPDTVNQFLKDKFGTDAIQLEKSGGEDTLYAASIMEVKVKWKHVGEVIAISIPNTEKNKTEATEVPGVSMKNLNTFYNSSKHPHPIAEISTKKPNEKIFMTPIDDNNTIGKDSHSLHNYINLIKSSLTRDPSHKGLSFPMVDFQDKGDMEDIKGASLDGNTIGQAKYQHSFQMDEKGAEGKAAAATATTRGMGIRRPLNITGPFLVWFETNGIVSFSAKITEKDMKKPTEGNT